MHIHREVTATGCGLIICRIIIYYSIRTFCEKPGLSTGPVDRRLVEVDPAVRPIPDTNMKPSVLSP